MEAHNARKVPGWKKGEILGLASEKQLLSIFRIGSI
jgi:hypothetical protein